MERIKIRSFFACVTSSSWGEMSCAIPLHRALHRALHCPVTCCLGLQAYRDAEDRLQSANEGLCVVHRKLEQLQSVEVEKDALQKVCLFSERTFNHGDRQTTSDTYAFNVRVCTMLVPLMQSVDLP